MKLKQISKKHKLLIQKHYDEIYNSTKRTLDRYKSNNRYINVVVEDIVGTLPIVVQEYDEEKDSNFVKFAVIRCFLRYLDEIKGKQRIPRATYKRLMLLETKRLDKIKEKGYCSPYDLEHVEDAEELTISTRPITENIYDVSSSGFVERIYWEDLKTQIYKRANTYFDETYCLQTSCRVPDICKTLVQKWLIPMSDGQQHPTLQELAKDLDVNNSYLSKLLHGDLMQGFIKSFGEDLNFFESTKDE